MKNKFLKILKNVFKIIIITKRVIEELKKEKTIE